MNTFLEKYDAIVVFGNYRYGSNALCDILHNFLKDSGVDAFNWSEYLSINQYIMSTDSGLVTKSMNIDYIPYRNDVIKLAERPIPQFIVKSKLEYFQKIIKKNFVIFKITPDDFKNGNDSLITDYIINNPRIFKLGLNRQDVANAALSNAIGAYFNIWGNVDNYENDSIDKKYVSVEYLNRVVSGIMLHNVWLYLNYNNLHQIVWYDEITELKIPEMELNNFSKTYYKKTVQPHASRAEKYFLSSDELLQVLSVFEKEMQPHIQNVRNISTHINNWKY